MRQVWVVLLQQPEA